MTERSAYGFEGSTTTRARVTIYTQSGETHRFEQPIHTTHRTSVVAVQVSRVMGQSGSFSVSLRASSPAAAEDLESRFEEDDWVDIEIGREGRYFHVMRGLLDGVRVSGVLSKEVVVYGRGFGKILETTRIYYDPWTDGEVEGAATVRIFDQLTAFLGDPPRTVDAILFGYIVDQVNRGRANWTIPKAIHIHAVPPSLRPNAVNATLAGASVNTGLQGTVVQDSFADFDESFEAGFRQTLLDPLSVNNRRTLAESQVAASRRFVYYCAFDKRGYVDDPQRSGVRNPMMLSPYDQFAWSLAQQWQDAELCEMYPTLLATGGLPTPVDGVDAGTATHAAGDSIMTIVFRDLPFPTSTRAGETIDQGPWFKLPEIKVPWRLVGARALTVSGADRVNLIRLAPKLFQGLIGAAPQLNRPLWDEVDIAVHGVRALDVSTNYISKGDKDTLLNVALKYRERLRDFYCMNHLYLAGTVSLNVSRPDAQPGMKLTIDGSAVGRASITGYIEGVEDTWTFERGAKTTIAMTRGFRGGDDAMLRALAQTAARFKTPDGPQL